jgi:uncharacterized protein YjbI with pentapeptide repeats
MSETFTSVSGKEIIRRILEGERDFSHTRLAPATALHEEEGFPEMIAYLRQQDLRATPVIAEGVDWRGLRAPGLFLQSARFAEADLSGADLRNSNLRRAAFNGARLQHANLEGAVMMQCRFIQTDLSGANMRGADMYEAKVNGAVFRDVDLTFAQLLRVVFESSDITGAAVGGVNFYRTDLRNVAGLESVRDLGRALFHHTMVTRRQLDTIQTAVRSLPLFDVQDG